MSKNNKFNLIKTGNLKKRKEKKRNMAEGGQVAVVSGLMEAPAFSDRIFCTESSIEIGATKATPPNSSPTLPSIHTLLTLSLHLTNTLSLLLNDSTTTLKSLPNGQHHCVFFVLHDMTSKPIISFSMSVKFLTIIYY